MEEESKGDGLRDADAICDPAAELPIEASGPLTVPADQPLPFDLSRLHKRIPAYKTRPRSRVATAHVITEFLPGSPYHMRDGSRHMVGRDGQLVKIEVDKLTKKQRNKLKREARRHD